MAGERHDIEQVDAELRRVGEATDALVRSAQELRGALDSLSESVRAVARDAAEAPTADGPEAPTADAPEVPSEPDPEPAVVRDEPEGARIVALNMVLDGRSRDEVADHLRDEFGYADSAELLDDVYSRVG